MASRILFICGSLEPGRDGVGDYVRQLSMKLLHMGHTVTAIALNDRHIEEEKNETQDGGSMLFKVLRLPAVAGLKQNAITAHKYIIGFAPQFVSLQFVPYSFNKKGLPFTLVHILRMLIQQTQLHIMFHELWMDNPKGLKQKIVTVIQKYLICQLIKNAKPVKIHVSVDFNRQRLQNQGFKSEILNLFGNIPQEFALATSARDTMKGLPTLLYFGSAIGGELLEQIIKGLITFCEHHPAGVKVLVASGTSQAKNIFIDNLESRLSRCNITIVDCGFLSTDAVSRLMNESTVGISKISARLLGKSGSSIAMLEHGLPLWMPLWDGKEQLDLGFREELIYADLSDAAAVPQKQKYKSLLPVVAAQFVQDLFEIRA
jgi:hypothetical protein